MSFIFLTIYLYMLTMNTAVRREIANHTRFSYYQHITGETLAESRHQILISVKQNNLDRINDLLYDRSSMKSTNYGKYLSFEEVGQLVENRVATNVVLDWLTSQNIDILSKTTYGEYIRVEATIQQLQHVFQTKFHEYRYTGIDYLLHEHRIYRAEYYELPPHIDEHISTIHHFTHLPAKSVRLITKITQETQSGVAADEVEGSNPHPINMDPTKIRQVYGVNGTGNGYSSQATYESSGQTYLPSDLRKFQSEYDLCDHPVDYNIGPTPSNSSCYHSIGDCDLASLDLQYMLGMAGKVTLSFKLRCVDLSLLVIVENVPTAYWYDPANTKHDFLIDFITSLSTDPYPFNVYSIGYGAYETDIHESSLVTFNTEAQKASLRGVTFIAAAGNDGVAGTAYLL
jgi:subtilase family serine protease